MQIEPLKIKNAYIIKPDIKRDDRGYFYEHYRKDIFREHGIPTSLVQGNTSKSVKGTIRGIHFQSPNSQSKIVMCVAGKIKDVLVDIRFMTFGGVESVHLSEGEGVYIPAGVAHGFSVLSRYAVISYWTNSYYSPKDEKGIVWDDRTVFMDWEVANPIVSLKDQKLPTLAEVRRTLYGTD